MSGPPAPSDEPSPPGLPPSNARRSTDDGLVLLDVVTSKAEKEFVKLSFPSTSGDLRFDVAEIHCVWGSLRHDADLQWNRKILWRDRETTLVRVEVDLNEVRQKGKTVLTAVMDSCSDW